MPEPNANGTPSNAEPPTESGKLYPPLSPDQLQEWAAEVQQAIREDQEHMEKVRLLRGQGIDPAKALPQGNPTRPTSPESPSSDPRN